MSESREQKLAREYEHAPAPYDPWPEAYRKLDRGANWLAEQFPQVDTGQRYMDDTGRIIDPNLEALEKAVGILGLAMPSGRAVPGTAGMFYGRKATTANPEAFARAERMIESGYAPKEVWKATPEQRIHYIPDAHEFPTFERSDRDAVFKNLGITDLLRAKLIGKQLTMKDIMDHPELYQNYPHLADLKVDPYLANPDSRGWFNPSQDTVGLNVLGGQQKATALHELQHAIQRHEGWQGGSSPEAIKRNAAEQLEFHRQDLADIKEAQKLVKSAKDPSELWESENMYARSSPETLKNWAESTQDKINRWERIHNNPYHFYQATTGEAYARHGPERGMWMSQSMMDLAYPLERGDIGGAGIGYLHNPTDSQSILESRLHDVLPTTSTYQPPFERMMGKVSKGLKWGYLGAPAASGLTGDTQAPPMGDMPIYGGGVAELLRDRR